RMPQNFPESPPKWQRKWQRNLGAGDRLRQSKFEPADAGPQESRFLGSPEHGPHPRASRSHAKGTPAAHSGTPNFLRGWERMETPLFGIVKSQSTSPRWGWTLNDVGRIGGSESSPFTRGPSR